MPSAAWAAEGTATPVAADLSPVARDYPNRALGWFFHALRAATVLSRNMAKLAVDLWQVTVLFLAKCSLGKLVNKLCTPVPHFLFTFPPHASQRGRGSRLTARRLVQPDTTCLRNRPGSSA